MQKQHIKFKIVNNRLTLLYCILRIKIFYLKTELYGDIVFKKIMGSDQFRKVTTHHKRIGYNLNVMRQSACLVINPITVDNFTALFNCKPQDLASDYNNGPT